MEIYKTWFDYLSSAQDNYLDPDLLFLSVEDEDVSNIEYRGYLVDGNAEINAYEIRDSNHPTVAILANADIYDVQEYIDGMSTEEPKHYYWLDTDEDPYHPGRSFALVAGDIDICGKKRRNTENPIVKGDYDELGVEPDICGEYDYGKLGNAFDGFIRARLGFVPEYEWN